MKVPIGNNSNNALATGATTCRDRHRCVITALAIALLICFSMVIAGCGQSSSSSAERSRPSEAFGSLVDSVASSVASKAESPLEVEGLTWDPATLANAQAANPDVYGWLYIPDTHVYYPVLKSPDGGDEDFYLYRDIYREDSRLGELYSQSTYNAPGFTDPVSLVYGHSYDVGTGLEDEMFGTLHNFEDKDFFDNHQYFYFFMPDEVRRYEIVSAYRSDNLHVLDGRDFSSPEVQQEYFDWVVNPDSEVKNVREGKTLKANENTIVQLSTCTRPGNDDYRYLVTGVLDTTTPINK